MEELSIMQGKGKIIINGKEYFFKNKVNRTFDAAANLFLAAQRLTNESSISITNTRITQVNGFSLIENSPNLNDNIAYDELAFTPISSFRVIGCDLYKTTIKAAALIEKSGTIRGGGFNIVTRPPKPTLNLASAYRRIAISVPLSYSLPQTGEWLYHPTSKALYCFRTNGEIHKIKYDMDIGKFGNHTIASTGWVTHSRKYSDGNSKMMALVSENILRVFDFSTDTISDVMLSRAVPNWNNSTIDWAWDERTNVLRRPSLTVTSEGQINGMTISLDGLVSINTGLYNTTFSQRRFGNDFIYYANGYYTYEATPTRLAQYTYSELNNMHYMFFKSNIFAFASFNATSPTTMYLEICKLPETYTSILSVEPITVEIGDSFSIEYSFTTGGD